MEYNTAICRGIPSSLIKGGQRLENDHSPIDEVLMRTQHDEYTGKLSEKLLPRCLRHPLFDSVNFLLLVSLFY